MGIGQPDIASGRNIVEPGHLTVSHLQHTCLNGSGGITSRTHICDGGQHRIYQRGLRTNHLQEHAVRQELSIPQGQRSQQRHGRCHAGIGYDGIDHGQTLFSQIDCGLG